MKYSMKELRARKNITQKELATAIGVKEQSVNRWEKSGIDCIKYSLIKKIADFFEVSISDLK